MKNNTIEILVGALVLLLAAIFLFLSFSIASSSKKISNGYKVFVEFNNIDGINIGSDVKISGVKIGNVVDIYLNDKNYKSYITIKLPKDLLIPTDSVFKVSTSGLIGNKFINIKIGSEEEYFKDSEKAEFTESSMDLEDLISRFLFNSGDKNEKNK